MSMNIKAFPEDCLKNIKERLLFLLRLGHRKLLVRKPPLHGTVYFTTFLIVSYFTFFLITFDVLAELGSISVYFIKNYLYELSLSE